MDLLKKAFILFALCFISDSIASFLPFPFPGSVLAMVILFILLVLGAIRTNQLTPVSDFLLGNMSLIFVPATVSIISYVGVLKDILWQFVFVCIITTVITFAATAYSVKLTIYLMNKFKGGKEQ